MVTGRHLEFKNGRRKYIIWHISEYIYNRRTKGGTHTLFDIWIRMKLELTRYLAVILNLKIAVLDVYNPAYLRIYL